MLEKEDVARLFPILGDKMFIMKLISHYKPPCRPLHVVLPTDIDASSGSAESSVQLN